MLNEICEISKLCFEFLSIGVFAGCHDRVDPQRFYDTCVYDSCAVPGNESLCDNLENYAKKCMDAGGDLSEWRREDLCRKLTYTLLNH